MYRIPVRSRKQRLVPYVPDDECRPHWHRSQRHGHSQHPLSKRPALESPDKAKKDHYMALVDFMTPIIKAYCSDMGFRVCETAMQCYGGYGFCRDYPIEQYLRDTKILSLYEGTNGIQALDLM